MSRGRVYLAKLVIDRGFTFHHGTGRCYGGRGLALGVRLCAVKTATEQSSEMIALVDQCSYAEKILAQ